MNSPIDLTGMPENIQPAPRRRVPLTEEQQKSLEDLLNQQKDDEAARRLAAAESVDTRNITVAPDAYATDGAVPVNPYAPTGWKRRERVEFDMTLPSGQLCRVMRLEREDLFRLNLMQYLDTFTPMLMDDAVASEAERDRKLKETITENPDALSNMFIAIDQVVMASTVKPKITDDEKLIDYGTVKDWNNPKFIATAYVADISMEDRMAIFAATFGRSMDDLKSLWPETPGVAGVADEPSVQQVTE